MAKVEFTYRSGGTRSISERDAKILSKLGRGTYLTRDLVAAPPAPVQVFTPPPAPVPAPAPEPDPVAEAPAVDLDAEGNAWDADLHVSTKLKNADGTWRKRPGAKTQE